MTLFCLRFFFFNNFFDFKLGFKCEFLWNLNYMNRQFFFFYDRFLRFRFKVFRGMYKCAIRRFLPQVFRQRVGNNVP